ncbi:hypothetical protein BDB00DRAFT_839844 [Zychaea mexicana]|uniref:uncharacterized protein n=1 Tax=Zychaea mexicana TaxID=64656 RepID=UPI0022FE7D2E|nr:uncharacterized protein BDB00DRAFT_839844 [Zychaea mexicana]KAI9490039.1 hypothetical protein BDB00DRAFT_839844 [Zychaea mexicana]
MTAVMLEVMRFKVWLTSQAKKASRWKGKGRAGKELSEKSRSTEAQKKRKKKPRVASEETAVQKNRAVDKDD